MAWFETKLSYRGSKLGPFWITISMTIFVLAMTVVYGKLFHQDVESYLPFLLCGLLNWYLMSNLVIRASDLFLSSTSFITQIKVPFFVYVFKLIAKELIIYGHNFLVYIAVLLILKINPGWMALLFIPGLILVLLNLVWVVVFLAMISSRYRDIGPIIASIVQVAFFISPITWMPKLLGAHSMILRFNPVTYLLNVTRDPLLGIMPPWYSWLVLLSLLIVGSAIVLPFFGKYHRRIPFWVL